MASRAIPRIVISDHARESLALRGLDPDWIGRTLRDPEESEPDPDNPGRVRVYRAIPERDGRVLRVVYEPRAADQGEVWIIVTAFLDRGRTRKRRRFE